MNPKGHNRLLRTNEAWFHEMGVLGTGMTFDFWIAFASRGEVTTTESSPLDFWLPMPALRLESRSVRGY